MSRHSMSSGLAAARLSVVVATLFHVGGCDSSASLGEDRAPQGSDAGFRLSTVPKERAPAAPARVPDGVTTMVIADGFRVVSFARRDRWTVVKPGEDISAGSAVP